MWNNLIYVGAIAPLVIAIFVALAVWKSASAQRTRRSLQEGLGDPDPAQRCSTLEGVDEHALSRYAPMFVRLLESETDPQVLDALAAAVARSRWEPTDNGNLVELRRWVAGRHAHESIDVVAGFEPRGTEGVATGVGETTTEPAPIDDHVDETPGAEPADRDAPADHDAPSDLAARAPAAASATAGAARTLVEPSKADLDELAPKVRELLGDDLARMELVSIDGRVLATWSAPESPELN